MPPGREALPDTAAPCLCVRRVLRSSAVTQARQRLAEVQCVSAVGVPGWLALRSCGQTGEAETGQLVAGAALLAQPAAALPLLTVQKPGLSLACRGAWRSWDSGSGVAACQVRRWTEEGSVQAVTHPDLHNG